MVTVSLYRASQMIVSDLDEKIMAINIDKVAGI